MSKYKNVAGACAAVLCLAMGSTQTQARASADLIENITAVIASQSLCGFTVNQEMLLIVMGNADVSPNDLKAGGLYGN